MINKENLKALPKSAGVYLFKDELGKVIYVGKAINLNNRVRQYFQDSRNLDNKTKSLVKNIDDFSYIATGTEMEAFILESNLIKKHTPKYNILLKDDKTYPYIKITTSEKFPRVIKTREHKKGQDTFFGPYSDTGSVNRTIDLVNQIFPTKKCTRSDFQTGTKPCLNFHIKKCKGICQNKITEEEYGYVIKDIMDFLKGKDKSVDAFLEERMNSASENLNYEEALRYRDYLHAAMAIREKQSVLINSKEDIDVVLNGDNGKVIVYSVIQGKLLDRQTYIMNSTMSFENEKDEVVLEFIRQHYGKERQGPKEILIDKMNNFYQKDIDMLQEYLGDLWGRKVVIYSPQKGNCRALMLLAKEDLENQRKELDEKIKKEQEREKKLTNELSIFADFSIGTQVESFDISNTFGSDSVGGMVVFKGLKPQKNKYRKFKVKTVPESGVGSDDYGSTQEILFRRLKRALDGDKAFLPLPNIIFLDGGKGHLEVAEKVLQACIAMSHKERSPKASPDEKNQGQLNSGTSIEVREIYIDDSDIDLEEQLKKIKLVGMAKNNKHRTEKLVWRNPKGEIEEYVLKENQFLFSYIGNIQEEVHRFAINYHKAVRGKSAVKSELEKINGIGKVKRNFLLNHFGSVKDLKKATLEEIKQVNGITIADAEKIYMYFNKEKQLD